MSTLVLSKFRFVSVLTGNHYNSSRWCRWFILWCNLSPNFPQLPFWNYLICQWHVQRIYRFCLSMRVDRSTLLNCYICSYIFIFPSAAIRAGGYCRRSLRPAVRSSVFPSVPNDVTTLTLSRIPAISLKFGRMMHEAYRYWQWPCSDSFSTYHETLKFSMMNLD